MVLTPGAGVVLPEVGVVVTPGPGSKHGRRARNAVAATGPAWHAGGVNGPEIHLSFAPELRLFVAPERRAGRTAVITDGVVHPRPCRRVARRPAHRGGRLLVDGRRGARLARPGARASPWRCAPSPARSRCPGAPLRFLLDVHLGTLARRLRLLGVDAAYESEDIGDPALAARSAAERRVLLSRDRGLLRRRELWAGAYVYSDRPDEQLRDVLGRFAPALAPWTRCTACNGRLERAPTRTRSRDRLEHGTQRTYDVFAQCTDCGRVYWRGAHHARLEAIVAGAMGEFGAPVS